MIQTLTISKLNVKDITLLADQSLFVGLIVIGTVRKLDIDEILAHSLSPLPQYLANCNGSLVNTNNTQLLYSLERAADPLPTVSVIPSGPTWVWDDMAIIQFLKSPPTFDQLAVQVLLCLVTPVKMSKSKVVHFISDRYHTQNIKCGERIRWPVGEMQILKIFSSEQKISKQWPKFLSSDQSMENLLQFKY